MCTRIRTSGSIHSRNTRSPETFRAATGDIFVSETTASYINKPMESATRNSAIDIYWLNDAGKIYHKHTSEVVEPYGLRPLPPRQPR